MPSLRQKIIAEFDETFGINGQDGKTYPAMDAQNVKQFLIQAIERTVEAMMVEKKDEQAHPGLHWEAECFGYNSAVSDLEINKKLILG